MRASLKTLKRNLRKRLNKSRKLCRIRIDCVSFAIYRNSRSRWWQRNQELTICCYYTNNVITCSWLTEWKEFNIKFPYERLNQWKERNINPNRLVWLFEILGKIETRGKIFCNGQLCHWCFGISDKQWLPVLSSVYCIKYPHLTQVHQRQH